LSLSTSTDPRKFIATSIANEGPCLLPYPSKPESSSSPFELTLSQFMLAISRKAATMVIHL
jgi:hypothetical protein